MQRKNKTIILSVTLLITFFITSCTTNTNQDKIIGIWERYDDRAAGTLVEVEKINDYFEGKILRSSGELAEDGFVENDIKWRNILKNTEDDFTGEDLSKAIDKFGKVRSSSYHKVSFEVIAEDILTITYFVKGTDEFGIEQRWKRIRSIQEPYVADSLAKSIEK